MQTAVIPMIVQQHADEIPVLARLRAELWAHPDVDMHDLFGIDQQLYAHLQGLRLAGDLGWKIAHDLFDQDPCGGTVLALAHLALSVGSATALQVLQLAVARDQGFARAAAVGACWHGQAYVQQILPWLHKQNSDEMQAIGVHLADISGLCLPEAIAPLINGPRASRLVAIGLAGRSGNQALAQQVAQPLADDDAQTEFARSFAAVLLTRGSPDLGRLREAAGYEEISQENRQLATCLYALKSQRSTANAREMHQGDGAPLNQDAVTMAGYLGNSALLPWLISLTENPQHSAAAMESIRLITGVDVERLAGPVDQTPLEDAFGCKAETGPPDKQLILQSWWQTHRHFGTQNDLVLGEIVSAENLTKLRAKCLLRDRALLCLKSQVSLGQVGFSASDAPYPLL